MTNEERIEKLESEIAALKEQLAILSNSTSHSINKIQEVILN